MPARASSMVVSTQAWDTNTWLNDSPVRLDAMWSGIINGDAETAPS